MMSSTEATKADVMSCLANCLTIVKAMFPSTLGAGLHVLSQANDQSTFTRSISTIEQRLMETDDQGEPYLDSGDRELAAHILSHYRRTLTR